MLFIPPLPAAPRCMFQSRAAVELEILRSDTRSVSFSAGQQTTALTPADRVLWVASFPNLEGLALDTGYSQTRDGHRLARKGFRLFWTWKVRRGKPGRPRVSCEVRDLGSVARGPATETRKHTE